jgi:hypothetical protein
MCHENNDEKSAGKNDLYKNLANIFCRQLWDI